MLNQYGIFDERNIIMSKTIRKFAIIVAVVIPFFIFILYALQIGPWYTKQKEDKVNDFSEQDIQRITGVYDINADNIDIMEFSKYTYGDIEEVYILRLSNVNDTATFVNDSSELSRDYTNVLEQKYKGIDESGNLCPNVYCYNDSITIVTASSDKWKGIDTDTGRHLYTYYSEIERLFDELYENENREL